jgi:predicted nucleotide-binding protein (sugar kinase/HSP70/actin superfamily)
MLPILTDNGTGEQTASAHAITAKRIYIPPMAYGSARAFAAAFRAIGLDAEPTPPSDHRTSELGAKYTSGDECYPAKVTVGDFMRLLEQPGTDPSRLALFMPTSEGPCRFGQYAPYLRHILDSNGYQSVEILSPTSKNAYQGLGSLAKPFMRTGWRALLCADLLEKLLLICRPYEARRGDSEAEYEESLADLCTTLESTPVDPGVQLQALRDSLVRSRQRFRKLSLDRHRTLPVVGIVGEIFCRLNTFSNENLVRCLEGYGAEAWVSDIVEWIWYTNSEHFRKLRLTGRIWTTEALGAWVSQRVQKRDEHVLVAPFAEDFRGREEPDIYEILECARPYLPREGAFGEMVLNVGKIVYLARKGAAGIIDISPFTCMNGIVCEAIYPRISRDLGGLPIRNFYFDGTQNDLDRDLGVYMELARSYQKRGLGTGG